jgi:hypothetical protein
LSRNTIRKYLRAETVEPKFKVPARPSKLDRFAAMASHYLFEPEFCNPASGWEKGQVEKNVQDARRRLWQVMPAFPDIDALNAWLEAQCTVQWSQIQHGVLPGTIADVQAAEVASLMPLGRPFDGFVEHAKRVPQPA